MCVFLLIAAVLLILAVLIQPGKGSGLASAGFSGISSQFSNMFGVRRTADFLQKFTIGLAIAILVLIIATNKFFLDTTATQGTNTGTGERLPVTVGAEKPAVPPAVQQQAAPQQPPPAQQGQTPAPQGK